MNPNVIQFACNHCQSWLTVPAHLAGVAGPCPKCGQHIVSPRSSEPAPASPSPLPSAQPPMPPAQGGPWLSARPPTGGLSTPAPAAYQAPAASGWGPPPIVPGAPLPVMPSVPMGPDASQGRGHYPQGNPVPQEQAPMWGAQHPPMEGMQQPAPHQMPGGYVPGATQAQPSIAMQPSLLRPQGSPHAGGPAAPPQMPSNAIADAMRQLPTGMPGQPGQSTPSAPLTRPVTVGGSRLSLLARQLTTSMDGAGNQPPPSEPQYQQGPASRDYQGRQLEQEVPRQAAGSQMNFQQAAHSPSGRGSPPRRRKSSGGKFAIAAAFLVMALGGGGYYFRDQLHDVWEKVLPPDPGIPSTVGTPTTSPTPGVDPAPGTLNDAASAKPQARELASSPSTQRIEPAPVVAKPQPQEQVAETLPPRAVPVTDGTLSGNSAAPGPGPMTAQAAGESTPATAPQVGVQTSRTPDRGMVASSASPSLVEIGRAKDDPSLLPKQDTTPMMANGDRPILRDVPPVCNVAVQGLKKFLAATNWKDRMPYVQLPDQMERKAQIYYSSNQDGPVNVDEIRYLRHDIDPQIGKGMHVVFELSSRAWDYKVPVMVEQIGDEARVDWLTFVEFKDNLLNKFSSNYMDGPVRFHVGIRRTHYFEDDVPNYIPNLEQKDAFEVTTPMDNVRAFVFTPKGTPLARSLASTLSWDKEVSWVVVELQWRKEGPAKWIELTALPQLNWYTDGSTPESVSAPSSPVAQPIAR